MNEVQDLDPPETDYAALGANPARRFTVSSMTARVRVSRTRVCPGRPGSVDVGRGRVIG